MAETIEPRVLETVPGRKLKLKMSDIIIFAAILVVIALLVATIVNRLNLKHEVSGARTVSDMVISKMAKQDASGIRALADKKFQSDHSSAELAPLLKPIAEIYGKTTPVIDQQIVSNNDKAQNVTFVYRYDRLKIPFYVRIGTTKPKNSSTWYLVNLGGSPDETKLLTPGAQN